MSKKHFIALADALRQSRPKVVRTATDAMMKHQWERDREAVAGVCVRFNGDFNGQRWYDYIDGKCGPNGGKI